MKTFARALGLLALMTVLTGVLYPLAVTGLAQVLFPRQAGGSRVEVDGVTRGSELIGQCIDAPGWFRGRPSATGPAPCNGAASGGSNLGPTNPALLQAVQARVDALRAEDPDNPAPIPVDLVTASGSGLDPDISPAAAHWQVRRVARVRGLDPARLHALVDAQVEPRQLGLLGEPRVNVLRLNLALEGWAP